jgi:hypothetical protein
MSTKFTRRQVIRSLGFDYDHAMQCAYNGRGEWWNSGSQHMNFVFPKSYFVKLGLVSLLDKIIYR